MSSVPYRNETRIRKKNEDGGPKSFATTIPAVSLLVLLLVLIIGVMLILLLDVIEHTVVVVANGHVHTGRCPQHLLDLLNEDGEFPSQKIRRSGFHLHGYPGRSLIVWDPDQDVNMVRLDVHDNTFAADVVENFLDDLFASFRDVMDQHPPVVFYMPAHVVVYQAHRFILVRI
jgi:hypothetical protein